MPSEKDLIFHIGNQLLELVYVQGTDDKGFLMGGESGYDDSLPIHSVRLSDFFLGKYPVTQGLWEAVMGNNPSEFQGDENRPVETVSWNEIMVSEGEQRCFMEKLNALIESHPENQEKMKKLAQEMKKDSLKFTLPSEAQWEYAARGGGKNMRQNRQWLNDYQYAGSNDIKEVAWNSENSHNESKPVGLKKPNNLGLYDMSGNVWEWCMDTWHSSYKGAPNDGSAWVDDNGSYRVIRSGGWHSNAGLTRLAYRDGSTPAYRGSDFGFRICLA